MLPPVLPPGSAPVPLPRGSAAPALSRWPPRLAALATAGYVGVLLFATHYPRPQEFLGSSPPSDKTLHFIAYGILGLLVGTTLALACRWSLRTALRSAAALALFAAFDEVTQPLPWFGRAADPLDWIYDCLGIAIGLGFVAATARLFRWLCGWMLGGRLSRLIRREHQ